MVGMQSVDRVEETFLQLLDAELSYWDAWERRERARTNLESATGEILQGVSFGNGSDR